MDDKTYSALKDMGKIVVLLLLSGVFLYLLTWTNTISCKTVPGWCQVFTSISGEPRVAIVFGDEGMGDPDLLQTLLSDPRRAGIQTTMIHIDTVSPGVLDNYKLVIVDKARKISSDKIKMFMDYASTGGRLVWTGDAGVEADEEDYLYKDEIDASESTPHEMINPWARKHRGFVLKFNEFLAVDYEGNYCDIKICGSSKPTCPGQLNITDKDHPLVFGLISNRQMCFNVGGDFAVTSQVFATASTVAATVDYQGSLVGDNSENFGNNNPVIVSNAKSSFLGIKIGETVSYYAIPPEYLADTMLPDNIRYPSIIENLYFGMLFG